MLAVIIVLATLLFGAVEIWSETAVMILVLATGLFWSIRDGKPKGICPKIPKNSFSQHSSSVAISGYSSFLCRSSCQFHLPCYSTDKDFYSISKMNFMPLSFDPYLTIHELLKAAAFFIVFFISSIVFRDREKLTKMIILLTVFGFCLAVFGLCRKQPGTIRSTGSGTDCRRHALWPLCQQKPFCRLHRYAHSLGLAYTLTREAREKYIFFGFLTVIMTLSLFFSLSRGGIVSFFAGMALFSMLIVITRSEEENVGSCRIPDNSCRIPCVPWD